VPKLTGNPLISNPRLLAAQAQSQFFAPLLASVAAANATAHADASPILEAVRELATVGELSSNGRVRFILVSDLRQFDPSRHPHPQSRRANSAAHGAAGLALLHADALVLFISRPGVSLDEELSVQARWRAHLEALGAGSIRVERL